MGGVGGCEKQTGRRAQHKGGYSEEQCAQLLSRYHTHAPTYTSNMPALPSQLKQYNHILLQDVGLLPPVKRRLFSFMKKRIYKYFSQRIMEKAFSETTSNGKSTFQEEYHFNSFERLLFDGPS